MPAKGDHVVFEGNKVGGARREGELLAVQGRLVRVRWLDGSESTLFPGAGAMRVLDRAPAHSAKKPVKKATKAAKAKGASSEKR